MQLTIRSTLLALPFIICPQTIAAEPPTVATQSAVSRASLTQAEAARQAAVLHDAIHATLQMVHHEFYREDEGLAIPAATLQDVFQHLEEEHRIKLHWLAVDGQAMNTDHVAATDFEKTAARELHNGKKFVEEVQDGNYRRAGAITLTNACLKCHVPNRKSTANQTAGLMISIPVVP